MRGDRPLARRVATLALLVLGAVALARLPLDYLPRQSFPELTVFLALDDASDPAAVAREWLEEIEGAVRTLGRVEEAGGEVRADGATLTVRFAPGTDPQRKAARLESELAGLRRRLPGGLWITPASEADGNLFAIVWLVDRDGSRPADRLGHRAVERAAEELRSVPGVQAVRVYGTPRQELRVELHPGLDPWAEAGGVRAQVEQALRAPALGRVRRGGREWPVVSLPSAVDRADALARLPVARGGGAVPLGSLAAIWPRLEEPPARVRFQGEPARGLFVWRSHGTPLLAVDRRLRQRLEEISSGGLRGTVGWSEAEPLRELAGRLLLGLAAASALGALAGARVGGRAGALALALAPAAAASAAANAFWLAGVGLNAATLTALALGSAAVLPAALLRVVRSRRPGPSGFPAMAATSLAAAAAVPVTVALGSAELSPVLGEPARAFLLAVAGALLAAAVLPTGTPVRSSENHRRPLRRLPSLGLRDPGTVVLAAATAGYVAAALFGPALLPRPADLAPSGGQLTLRLRLPEGSTLEETGRAVREIERHLKEAEEIESFWSRIQAGDALVVADVRRRDRRPARLAALAARLRYLAGAGGALRIETGLGPAGRPAARTLEDRPEADEEGHLYRAVLRSADLEALAAAHVRALGRLDRLKVREHWLTRRDAPAVRLLLEPRPGTPPERAVALAAHLRRASLPAPGLELPAPPGDPGAPGRVLRVAPAGVPLDPDHVPSLEELLRRPFLWNGAPVLPAAALSAREEPVWPRVDRQSGRFVLPLEVRIPYSGEQRRLDLRRELDRALGQLPLPTGVDLERPSLAPGLLQRERLRLAALALAVPLLLFAVAACRLGSLLRGLAALAPLALGLLAAAPLLRSGLGQADDLTLFALAAALALALPFVVEGALPGGGTPPGSPRSPRPAQLYRRLRGEIPWLAGGVPAVAAGLAVPTLGLDPLLLRWVMPLRAAALAGGTALLASALLAPALLLLGRGAVERVRRPGEVRRRRRPPAWSEPGPPVLEVRSLSKVYGGRVAALSGVSFELTPGIVGLLGPNGAGKTTLLRLLTGLLEPTRGVVRFRGVAVTPENRAEYRRRIGFLPQDFNAYPELTAEQFLDHWAREQGMGEVQRRREIEALLAAVGLGEHAGRKVRDFSGGMRQRVGIARALLGAPPILIVDEPTTGLDVESRTRFRQILLEQAAERIVLFSTHIAGDIEAAASRILLLTRGGLRFDGSPEELIGRARGRVFRAVIGDAELAAFSRRYRITARVRTLEGLRVRAVARPGEPLAGEEVEPGLEEAYLAETDLCLANPPGGG